MRYAILRADGLYLFDENLNLIEKIEGTLSEEELLLIEEKKLPEKIKAILPKDVVFLGQEFEGYSSEKDPLKVSKALDKILVSKDIEKRQRDFVSVTISEISESVTRDQIIIQAISLLDDLNKITNLMMERFREWYELYLPEVSQMIEDHEKFLKTIYKKRREELMREFGIEKTMGGDLKEEDINMLEELANEILRLYKLRDNLKEYIDKLMQEVAPNVREIAGPTVGARLIALAGGLKELAQLPSSTIQVLGAEKALFRHLRKGTPPPKHGILFNHPFIQKLPKKYRGAMARTLASKIAIAAKVDAFNPGKIISDKIMEELKERFEQLKKGIKEKKKNK